MNKTILTSSFLVQAYPQEKESKNRVQQYAAVMPYNRPPNKKDIQTNKETHTNLLTGQSPIYNCISKKSTTNTSFPEIQKLTEFLATALTKDNAVFLLRPKLFDEYHAQTFPSSECNHHLFTFKHESAYFSSKE